MSRATHRGGNGRSGIRSPGRPAALLPAALLAALLALTACSGTAGHSGEGGTAAEAPAAVEDDGAAAQGAPEAAERAEEAAGDDAADAADASSGFAEAPSLPSSLHLIRTAHLSVITEDVAKGYREAVDLAERAGGYVSDEQTDEDSAGYQRSRITLRVPPEEYGSLLQGLAGLGELEYREVTTEDVTRQVVDVESRIASQEESVARVRELMEDAATLTDVVTLEAELSRRQADLEALKAQQKSLAEQTGMATITLELREPEAAEVEKKDDEKDTGPSLPDALRGGWEAFLTTLLWIAVVLGAALPFVVALAAVLLFARWLRGRLPQRGGRSGRAPAPAPPPVPAPLTVERTAVRHPAGPGPGPGSGDGKSGDG
ncbi:DUF4349 domain-containing protein [Streptomyces sp. YIM 98790]|uniref:DUF4349 domain-containing protein n=1 Tax=Streptomyces sp. YIM 98790 TaxID=2689077 RepID=UPI00140C738A|nr:DUF4349 domain-containing protein [Streptomyces sp. YIM 98790]